MFDLLFEFQILGSADLRARLLLSLVEVLHKHHFVRLGFVLAGQRVILLDQSLEIGNRLGLCVVLVRIKLSF